jgi:hypothetical protein
MYEQNFNEIVLEYQRNLVKCAVCGKQFIVLGPLSLPDWLNVPIVFCSRGLVIKQGV